MLLALSLPACALPADDADPATSEAVGELGIGTPGHWSTLQASFGVTWQPAQVGAINGRTFTIRAGYCADVVCFDGYNITSLDAYEYVAADANFSHNTSSIPKESTHDKVSLAVFNGYLYMVHIGGGDDADQHKTYITHFDPATNLWAEDHSISYPAYYGPPALVPFNGKLYFIGAYASSQIYYGTMDTNENYTNPVSIPGHLTTGRISAAVAFGKVFFTHRDSTSSNLVYGVSADGSNWTPINYIYGGPNNGALQGYEAAIASDGNHLHLVHTRPGDNYVWWTQFDNCHWSTSEAQIGGIQTELPPALGPGISGLVLLTETHNQHWYDIAYATWTPPSMPSRCVLGSP